MNTKEGQKDKGPIRALDIPPRAKEIIMNWKATAEIAWISAIT